MENILADPSKTGSKKNAHVLEACHIYKSFPQPGSGRLIVLQDLNLQVSLSSFIAITGVSGSGKSTLLHLLGGLDNPDDGEILFKGENIRNYQVKERSSYRNRHIGFIFQFHYLMPELNVLENVAFPFLLHTFDKHEALAKAEELLVKVELKDKILYSPADLSGGERQRVAIARSLINSPTLLLADEPTGNLDSKTGNKVFAMFKEIIKSHDLTAIIVTHNEQLAQMTEKIFSLQEGKLV